MRGKQLQGDEVEGAVSAEMLVAELVNGNKTFVEKFLDTLDVEQRKQTVTQMDALLDNGNVAAWLV